MQKISSFLDKYIANTKQRQRAELLPWQDVVFKLCYKLEITDPKEIGCLLGLAKKTPSVWWWEKQITYLADYPFRKGSKLPLIIWLWKKSINDGKLLVVQDDESIIKRKLLTYRAALLSCKVRNNLQKGDGHPFYTYMNELVDRQRVWAKSTAQTSKEKLEKINLKIEDLETNKADIIKMRI